MTAGERPNVAVWVHRVQGAQTDGKNDRGRVPVGHPVREIQALFASRSGLSGRVDANTRCALLGTNTTVAATPTMLLVLVEVIALAATFCSAVLALARVFLALRPVDAVLVLVAFLADPLALAGQCWLEERSPGGKRAREQNKRVATWQV